MDATDTILLKARGMTFHYDEDLAALREIERRLQGARDIAVTEASQRGPAVSVKDSAPNSIYCIREPYTVTLHDIRSIHRGGTFMKNLSRLDVIRRLAFSMLLILPATLGAQTRPPIFEKVAKMYGLDSWDKIEAIRYTWNLQLGTLNVSRSWEHTATSTL
jgi:hypothetical protein